MLRYVVLCYVIFYCFRWSIIDWTSKLYVSPIQRSSSFISWEHFWGCLRLKSNFRVRSWIGDRLTHFLNRYTSSKVSEGYPDDDDEVLEGKSTADARADERLSWKENSSIITKYHIASEESRNIRYCKSELIHARYFPAVLFFIECGSR